MTLKKVIQINILLITFCIIYINAGGQINYVANIYGVKDGLGTAYGRYLQKDSQGFIWFASEKGLHRYDGNSLHVFKHRADDPNSIASNNCNGIFQDSKKQLWINTDEGLSLFDAKKQIFENYKIDPSLFPFLSLNYTDMAEDHAGRIWIGGNHDALIFDTKTKKFIRSGLIDYAIKSGIIKQEKRNSITQSLRSKSENELWLLTVYGLFLVNTKTMQYQYYPNQKLDDYFAFNISHIDKKGTLWITTYDQCFYSFDPLTTIWTHYTCPPHDKNTSDQVFNIDKWAGDTMLFTRHDGCWKYSLVDNKYFYVELSIDGGKQSPPFSLIEYLEGDFYLFKNSPNEFIHLKKGESIFSKRKLPLPADFRSNHSYILEGDKVIVGDWDREEILICDKLKCDYLRDQNGSKKLGNLQLNFKSRSGMYFFSTSQNIYKYNPENKTTRALNIIGGRKNNITHEFRNFIEDEKGNIYVRNRHHGIYKIDLENNAADWIDIGLEDNNYSALHYDQLMRKIWLASESNGIYTIDGTTKQIKNYPVRSLTNSTRGFINDINGDDQGNVYLLIAGQGMVHITSKDMKHRLYTTQEGLNSEVVSFGYVDKERRYWFTTDMGLNAFDQKIQKITTFENNTNNHLFTYRLCSYDDSEIVQNLFPDHILSFNRNILYQEQSIKKIYLKEIKLLGKTLAHQEHYLFKSGQNNLDLSFGYLDQSGLQKVKFQYKLNDQPWQDLEEMKLSMYNLAPSKYELAIKQKYSDIIGLNLRFEILPPWWKTWWFYTLIASVFISTFIYFYKNKIKNIRIEEAKKNELNQKIAAIEMSALRAQMNPHFIFNCLSSINRYILSNDNEKASDYLTKFSKLIRMILDDSRENFIPLSKEIESLKLYIEMESMRFQDSFEWHIDVADDVAMHQIMIPPLMLQPYVENAIWHGFMKAPNDWGIKKIDIQISKKNQSIVIEITDNGIGIEKSTLLKTKADTSHKSYGILLNQNRLELMQQLQGIDVDVQISDRSNEEENSSGTRVKIIINQKEINDSSYY